MTWIYFVVLAEQDTQADGDAVRLASRTTVSHLTIGPAARGGIYGLDVTHVRIVGNDLSHTNTGCRHVRNETEMGAMGRGGASEANASPPSVAGAPASDIEAPGDADWQATPTVAAKRARRRTAAHCTGDATLAHPAATAYCSTSADTRSTRNACWST